MGLLGSGTRLAIALLAVSFGCAPAAKQSPPPPVAPPKPADEGSRVEKVREIATTKMPDLNANDIDAAMKIVEGTARSMGITTD